MKDNRTREQKLIQLTKDITQAKKAGWAHIHNYIFVSPSNSKHDLSSADFNKLKQIEYKKIFLA